ncbi:pilus assembly PilX family protein [Luteolibacter marinus]|uniref:pilus assembly PilX family protein n=1 Tax=Luteolibacter marinus TaxID=2776705 RepID=UPI0018693165|nr:pilus assembly PilX N-terminal domain-containing protein [Luteolibacter marinus]
MKTKQAYKPGIRRGFALVVTMSLMVLLTMLVMALVQLGSIAIRSSSRLDAMTAARANAMVSLNLAIGQLQRTLGPDQRITAPASLAPGRSSSEWCGVWSPGDLDDSGLSPAVGWGASYGSPLYLTDRRTKRSGWKDEWFIEELVTTGTAADAGRITVGMTGDGDEVEVPELRSDDNGGLAWWIEDLSQRASVGSGVSPADAGGVGLASAPRVDASPLSPEGASWDSDPFASDRERENTITMQTLELAAWADIGGLDSPVGTRSFGLFTDPVNGGLKGDLTRFVESEDEAAGVLPQFALDGIRGEASILPEPFHTVTGPRWDRLRRWFRAGQESTPGSAVAATVPESIRAAKVYGGEGYAVDAIKSSELPLHPVVVDAGFHWDYTPETDTAQNILCHVYPRLTLWNPYNVEMDAGRYVIAMPKHIDSGGGLSVEVADQNGAVTRIPTVVAGWGAQFRASGEASDHYFLFTVEATTFGPGECLVFTPRTGGGARSAQPYDAARPSSNILTAAQPVGSNNFYIRHFSTKPDLARMLARGMRVKRYITTPLDSPDYAEALHWNPKPFLLKACPGSSFSSAEVLTGKGFPTLQRLYVNDGGGGKDYFASAGQRAAYIRYSPGWNDDPSNNGSEWATFKDNPNRNPPRNWYYRVHQSWIDDEKELAAVGRLGSPQPPYASAVMADWNPMASVVFRTPSTYLLEHFDLHVGCWYRCKAPHDALGPDQDWGIFADGLARGCPFGDPREYASQLSFPLIDLPEAGQPLQSIGALRNAPLSPWLWHPARIVGTSRPSLHADRDAGAIPTLATGANPWKNIIVQTDAVFGDLIQENDHRRETLLYDIAYSVNRRLWDSFFASSWSVDSGWNGHERLPNRQLVAHPLLGGAEQARKASVDDAGGLGLWLSAYLLVNGGAFNVNSTSVEAWAAVLGGLKGLTRTTAGDGSLDGDHPFARFRQPVTADPLWGGSLALSDDQVQELAGEIVEIVRERGPFLGVADFVNRRLATGDSAEAGVIDEALLRANLVSGDLLKFPATGNDNDSKVRQNLRSREENASQWKLAGSAGFIEQGDILEPVGGALCARGDTFRIRATGVAYGERGEVLSRATCEAVVVRSPDYLLKRPFDDPGDANSGNSALVAPMTRGIRDSKLVNNPQLHPLNQRFGRRFEVLGIKWLKTPSES